MPKKQTNRLKHKIEIWGNKKTKNELGEVSYMFELLQSNVAAEIIPQTGSLMIQQAETILTNVTHKIILRYQTEKRINQNMQIRYKEHVFKIKYILNPYFKNEKLEIFVQELIV